MTDLHHADGWLVAYFSPDKLLEACAGRGEAVRLIRRKPHPGMAQAAG
jgi:hypothetical protein